MRVYGGASSATAGGLGPQPHAAPSQQNGGIVPTGTRFSFHPGSTSQNLPPNAPAAGFEAATMMSLPSGSALASLSASAQRNGLSLDQMAALISQTPNLAVVLVKASQSQHSDVEAKKRKLELARDLFQTEASSLYRRSMLQAGFSAEESSDESQLQLDFAVEAWHAEGLRLQQRLQARGGTPNTQRVVSSPALSAQLTPGSGSSQQQLPRGGM